MGQHFVDDRIGEREEVAVAGSITSHWKSYDIGAAVRKAALRHIPHLPCRKSNALDEGDTIRQIDGNICFAAGAAKLEIEVVGAVFGIAVAPKTEEATSINITERRDSRVSPCIGCLARKDQAAEWNRQGVGIEKFEPILVGTGGVGGH